MTTTTAAPGSVPADLPRRGATTLVERSNLDNFIVGMLAMFLLVYASELLLLVPCGSFGALQTCDLPPAAKAFWSTYFTIDPLFGEMPPFYAMIMSIQDYLYNPWWTVCLFMFWTGRQETGWLKTGTLLISGMIIATGVVNYGVQLQHPAYTAAHRIALLLINGPWIAGPLLLAWRCRSSAATGRSSGTRARALALIALPTAAYTALCAAAIAIS